MRLPRLDSTPRGLRRSTCGLVLSVSVAWLSYGCAIFERADANKNQADGEPSSGGSQSTTGGMGGGTFMGSGGNDSGGAGAGGLPFGSGGAEACGMVSNPQEVEIVVESYEITGDCTATVSHSFDSDVEGFNLNVNEGVMGTTASSFAHCDGGLDVTLTMAADGRAEVRSAISAGTMMNGCSLNATVRLVADDRCGFMAGLQLYPGTDGDVGITQFGPAEVLTAGESTNLTFTLDPVTTAGTDASYGVTFYRGDLSCE